MEENMNNSKIDTNIVKRLLKYTKPYLGYVMASLVVLLLLVGVELYMPVIVGTAVDEIITDYNNNYYVSKNSKTQGIQIGDYYISHNKVNEDDLKSTMIYDEESTKGYYIVYGIDDKSLHGKEVGAVTDGETIMINNHTHRVIMLDQKAIEYLRRADINQLIRLTVFYVIALLLSLFLSYYQVLLLHIAGQKIIYNIRDEVFSHIQKQSVQYFNQNPVGKLVTRVTNDTENLNEMYTNVISHTVKNVMMLLGLTIMMFRYSTKLSLAVFSVMPLVVIATVIFRFFSRRIYRDVRTKISHINTFLSEHISGMKIVQIFTKEDYKKETFDETNKGLLQDNIKQLIVFSIYRPFLFVANILCLAIVLGYGGLNVMNEVLTIGTLVIFLQYLTKFFQPIQELAEQFNVLQSAIASAEKIFSLIDEDTSVKDEQGAIELTEVRGEIEFRNVWFAYKDDDWVLKDVSFKANQGEVVAFVGATGAGKTSILNLISRYFEIQKGEILIDGINIKNYTINSLRQQVGQMLQDVFLFSGDINSNIRLKDETITEEEIIKASKYINAHHFIEKLPEKYNEEVNERGTTLSAGQRQLLSFARTLAVNPSVLILDEATSSIDTETEKLIQDALIKLMEGRTTLVVAHRLSTIQHADKIVVLHKGHIKEIGNHQQLLAEKGIYYQLYQLQYQDIS